MEKMKIKEIINRIPKLPLTALIFYLTAFVLWNLNLIPPPTEIVVFLENLYNRFGFFGLFIATFLEGIIYLGLYFPGSFIVALAVFFSDGKFISLLNISIIVALTLTLTAFINYWLGKHISLKNKEEVMKSEKITKGLFASMLHPNLLAFYFFNEGLEKGNIRKISWVPVIMIPYGLAFAYMLSIFSTVAKQKLESPLFLMSLIILWMILAFVFNIKRKYKRR